MTNEEKQQAMRTIDGYLHYNVYQNHEIMFNDDCCDNYVPEIIAGLQDFIHMLIEGKPYDYAFHWANKIGADVARNFIDEMLDYT